MVSILLWIQTKKIKLRNDLKFRGSTYRPIWAKNAPTDNKEERDIDPCPVFINLTDNSNYHYISNYNGYSPQIGNCILRKDHGNFLFTYYRPRFNLMTKDDFKSDWYQLHLAMEITRRKAMKDGEEHDPFYDLPVILGIVMATKLIQNDVDDVLHEFVYQDDRNSNRKSKHHIFSGNNRMNNFYALLVKYRAYHNIELNEITILLQTLEQDCRTFLQIPLNEYFGCDFNKLTL